MARQIIWSKRAQEDRKCIFSYWNKRDKSVLYSKKQNRLFIEAAELLAIHPKIGRESNKENVRIKVPPIAASENRGIQDRTTHI